MTGVFVLVQRYDGCVPLSHPSSCMPVNHGLPQLSSKRIQAMEMRCYRKVLRILYKGHVTNVELLAKIQQAIGPHEDLLTIVKRRKLLLYRHTSRASKTILQGIVKGGRKQTEEEVGRQHQGMDRPGICQVQEGSGE